ncbi:multiple sugar transport system substrate-binding protein [Pseudobutyrivibrio sp. ACV-2]|uniref:ABC transporter substrate-binding protein n=1 Tax=Pseudobutyrivibrio sp. ACV-2 TaxID=1520801 RepID=UPI00089D18B0|nr:extracellular solute-binding protein [Pseudobutyrivibrio sp. ACV-2]SEA82855.1 multiple sugar transport system substrate-binding protein [Pseudobutyrivibrio sp. ACV-2]
MKLKKFLATLLVGAITLSMVACGSDGSDGSATLEGENVNSETVGSEDGEKLVIWTLAKDLQTFAEKYAEDHNVQIETVVIEPADYVTKVQTALNGGQTTPDIIVGEPQMLEDFYDAEYFEDLNQEPYNAQDYADQIVDYVWKVGQDSEGIQRAISYQITPAGIYYRRDIAEKVFGTEDPDEIGKLFADYDTVLKTAKTLKDAGYRIFASDAEINYFSGDSAWVVDGKLNVNQARLDYMDLVIDLYQNDYTAYANQWSTPWYQAMAGEVPILTADIQNYADDSVNVWDAEQFEEATKDLDKTEVFAFGLPSWGVLTLRDNVGETSGKWGVCSGPASGFGGGTFIGISAQSEHKDLAWDFLKWVTLDEDTAEWWIEKSEGDTVSLVSVLEKHKDDENPVYGNEHMYSFWQSQAEDIDYSKVTRYDKVINDAWGAAITAIKTGEKSKDDAIAEFYDVVESTYPDITVER